MKSSTELIAYYHMREQALGEKATKPTMFLEGYGVGLTDTEEFFTIKALTAFCMTECQRKSNMPCAHLADGGCTNYRKFKQLIKGE